MDIIIGLLTALLGIMASILVAAIPWAYSVHGRLARIETTLQEHIRTFDLLVDLERRVTRLEMRTNDEP